MNTITLKRNNDVVINFTVDFDITDYTILFTVKETLDDDPADENAIIAKELTFVSTYVATLALSAEETDQVNSEYVFDLAFINNTDGKRSNTERGKFILTDVVGNRNAS